MSKILSVAGFVTVVSIAAAAGFIGGAYITAKAAFSGAMAATTLNVKVDAAKKDEPEENEEA